jgi:glucuronoarabinoxylan endo-1,4-beta-xylanase
LLPQFTWSLLSGIFMYITSARRLTALFGLLSVIIAPLGLACAAARKFGPESLFNAFGSDRSTITINWSSPRQAIDGFGASTAGVNPRLSPKLMDFFYTDKGIHLNLIRVEIWPSVADCEAGLERGECVATPRATISKNDLANAQAAVARGARVWAAEWSPPGSMKSNGNFLTGGPFIGSAANFANLATLQASFVTLLARNYGITLYALSPQNEPDVSVSYASCTWTAQQLHDYVPYLAQALSSAGYGSVKLMIAEEGIWGNSYSAAAMNDPAVASKISILAAHEYKGVLATPLSWNNLTTQHIWETEVSDFGAYDDSMTSGLTYARMIHGALTSANVNAWHYWSLSGISFQDNEGLTDSFGHPAKRAYTLGNYSKFVLPGWTRVDVANTTGLLVSAYKGPDTGAAIVVVNGGPAVVQQQFKVGDLMGASVVPWITSRKLNLKAQAPVPVSSGSFASTIPANSVVTFASGR